MIVWDVKVENEHQIGKQGWCGCVWPGDSVKETSVAWGCAVVELGYSLVVEYLNSMCKILDSIPVWTITV